MLDMARGASHNRVVTTAKADKARTESLARSLATSKRTLAVIAKRLESGDYRTETIEPARRKRG